MTKNIKFHDEITISDDEIKALYDQSEKDLKDFKGLKVDSESIKKLDKRKKCKKLSDKERDKMMRQMFSDIKQDNSNATQVDPYQFNFPLKKKCRRSFEDTLDPNTPEALRSNLNKHNSIFTDDFQDDERLLKNGTKPLPYRQGRKMFNMTGDARLDPAKKINRKERFSDLTFEEDFDTDFQNNGITGFIEIGDQFDINKDNLKMVKNKGIGNNFQGIQNRSKKDKYARMSLSKKFQHALPFKQIRETPGLLLDSGENKDPRKIVLEPRVTSAKDINDLRPKHRQRDTYLSQKLIGTDSKTKLKAPEGNYTKKFSKLSEKFNRRRMNKKGPEHYVKRGYYKVGRPGIQSKPRKEEAPVFNYQHKTNNKLNQKYILPESVKKVIDNENNVSIVQDNNSKFLYSNPTGYKQPFNNFRYGKHLISHNNKSQKYGAGILGVHGKATYNNTYQDPPRLRKENFYQPQNYNSVRGKTAMEGYRYQDNPDIKTNNTQQLDTSMRVVGSSSEGLRYQDNTNIMKSNTYQMDNIMSMGSNNKVEGFRQSDNPNIQKSNTYQLDTNMRASGHQSEGLRYQDNPDVKKNNTYQQYISGPTKSNTEGGTHHKMGLKNTTLNNKNELKNQSLISNTDKGNFNQKNIMSNNFSNYQNNNKPLGIQTNLTGYHKPSYHNFKSHYTLKKKPYDPYFI